MTNMWLLMDDLPFCALGRSRLWLWMHAEIRLSPRTSCYIKIPLSLTRLCLESFMDQWDDAHQHMWHCIHIACSVTKRESSTWLLTTGDTPLVGKLTSSEMLPHLLPYAAGEERRIQEGSEVGHSVQYLSLIYCSLHSHFLWSFLIFFSSFKMRD